MIQGHGDDLYLYPNVKVNFSSNVYSGTEHRELLEYLGQSLDHLVSSYPEPEPYTLQAELARYLELHPDQILVTNGATEAIYLTAQLFAGAKSYIYQPTFSEYESACRVYGHRLVDQKDAQLHWLCNPNNPTGELYEEEHLSLGQTYVIDRSYEYFCRYPLRRITAEVLEAEDRIYIHSLTKRYRLPGLRLGYVVAPRRYIDRLRSLRQPWSVNALALEAGRWLVRQGMPHSIDLPELFRETDRLRQTLSSYGYEVSDSATHFFTVRTPYDAAELKSYSAANFNLLIRNASNFYGLSTKHIRIATQRKVENDLLLEALKPHTLSLSLPQSCNKT